MFVGRCVSIVTMVLISCISCLEVVLNSWKKNPDHLNVFSTRIGAQRTALDKLPFHFDSFLYSFVGSFCSFPLLVGWSWEFYVFLKFYF